VKKLNRQQQLKNQNFQVKKRAALRRHDSSFMRAIIICQQIFLCSMHVSINCANWQEIF